MHRETQNLQIAATVRKMWSTLRLQKSHDTGYRYENVCCKCWREHFLMSNSFLCWMYTILAALNLFHSEIIFCFPFGCSFFSSSNAGTCRMLNPNELRWRFKGKFEINVYTIDDFINIVVVYGTESSCFCCFVHHIYSLFIYVECLQ